MYGHASHPYRDHNGRLPWVAWDGRGMEQDDYVEPETPQPVINDEDWLMEDRLAPARGCLVGLGISLGGWLAAGWLVYAAGNGDIACAESRRGSMK